MIICPNCGKEFETDAEIISFVVDSWVDRAHTRHMGTGFYECPVCSETYDNIEAFYGEDE